MRTPNFNLKTMKDQIKKAVDQNILVFDFDGSPNITKRLLYLMFSTMENEYGETPQTLYIPTMVYPEFDPWERVWGMSIERVKALNEGELLHDYYSKELKGSFPSGKSDLVLAVGKSAVLLGAC